MSIEFKPVNEFKAEVFWGGEAFGHIVWGAGAKAFIPWPAPRMGPASSRSTWASSRVFSESWRRSLSQKSTVWF